MKIGDVVSGIIHAPVNVLRWMWGYCVHLAEGAGSMLGIGGHKPVPHTPVRARVVESHREPESLASVRSSFRTWDAISEMKENNQDVVSYVLDKNLSPDDAVKLLNAYGNETGNLVKGRGNYERKWRWGDGYSAKNISATKLLALAEKLKGSSQELTREAVFTVFSGFMCDDIWHNSRGEFKASEATLIFQILAKPFFSENLKNIEHIFTEGETDNWKKLCESIEHGLADAEQAGEEGDAIRGHLDSIKEYVPGVLSWVGKYSHGLNPYPKMLEYSRPKYKPTGWH